MQLPAKLLETPPIVSFVEKLVYQMHVLTALSFSQSFAQPALLDNRSSTARA